MVRGLFVFVLNSKHKKKKILEYQSTLVRGAEADCPECVFIIATQKNILGIGQMRHWLAHRD